MSWTIGDVINLADLPTLEVVPCHVAGECDGCFFSNVACNVVRDEEGKIGCSHDNFIFALHAAPKINGTKADEGKLPLDLMAFDAIEGTAAVLQFGAKKYAPRNWEKGIVYSRVFAALLRHLYKWWRGIDLDDETGLSHLDHAACCLMFLQAYVKRDMHQLDDRPSKIEEKINDQSISRNSLN